ncbi:MAG: hypothetical protein A6D91_07895 [Bacillaceae bacterium G1]|nr:MAG: hypothetical protein A6D91_07895 [Bacillaceae bacterium G1]
MCTFVCGNGCNSWPPAICRGKGTIQEVACAKESQGSTGTISAVMEEQAASMEEVSASAESLSRMAEELQRLVQQLNI